MGAPSLSLHSPTRTFTPTSDNDYRGFTSDDIITSPTISSTTNGSFGGLDNFIVGHLACDVPAPGSLALMGLVVCGLLAARRHKA